jgi:dephospho-CoA kinase
MAVLEVPLLFEAGGHSAVDAVVVASASPAVQKRRVLERPGMTAEKLDRLLARQMPDAEKRSRAQFVVDTDGSVEACNAQVDAMIPNLERVPAQAYMHFWS